MHSCSDNNIDPDFLVPNMFWCFIEKTWTAFSLLAQLVECCTGIAEVMGSNPVQA